MGDKAQQVNIDPLTIILKELPKGAIGASLEAMLNERNQLSQLSKNV